MELKKRMMYYTMAVVFVLSSFTESKAQQLVYDYVIKGATVFDGSGKDSVICDVAISADKIAFVGNLSKGYTAKHTIEAQGLYLSPGFIDPHTHYGTWLNHANPSNRLLAPVILQGVTTVFTGNDGSSLLLIGRSLDKLDKQGIGPNVATFIGHSTVRRKVLGTKDVQPTDAQLKEMEKLVENAMKEGALGISTGLFYTPANFAHTEEVVALSRVAAKYGGIYDTHQRDEGSQSIGIVNSTKEVLNIGYETGIPVNFSHIKIDGPAAWPKLDSVIYLIEKAQKEGLKVTANQYPYAASHTHLAGAVVPTWVRDGGTEEMRKRFSQPELRDSILKGITENIKSRTGDASKLLIYISSNKEIHQQSLQAIADKWKMSPAEAVIKMCTEGVPSVISFSMQEKDIEKLMKKPWVMTGSDGGVGGGHPRSYGSFAHVIGEYVQKRKVISMSQAIHRSSYLTAQTFNIKKRGLIKEGFYADLFLFNPKTYRANNSYENGKALASGVKYLWVNGKIVIDDGNLQTVLNGRALRLNQQ